MTADATPVRLPPSAAEEVTSVIAEAFAEYPVPRFILGPEHADDRARLRQLVGFFVGARVLRGEPMLGVRRNDRLVAAAIVSSSKTGSSPPELERRREALWRELGAEARARYEAFGTATRAFAIERPHLHLNMVGVVAAERGEGYGRLLVDAVQRLAGADPDCAGVTLTTEDPKNVSLYLHLGYRITGHARIAPELETWGFFREREA